VQRCELEIHALNNPYYGIERFGVHFVASPRHADMLLVTGPVSRNMEAALRRTGGHPRPETGDCDGRMRREWWRVRRELCLVRSGVEFIPVDASCAAARPRARSDARISKPSVNALPGNNPVSVPLYAAGLLDDACAAAAASALPAG